MSKFYKNLGKGAQRLVGCVEWFVKPSCVIPVHTGG